jgi:hypothetical protein
MAQVLDYHVVVKKGEFKAGDLAMYIEIDSIVPDGLPVEHLPTMQDLVKKFHAANKTDKVDLRTQMDELEKLNTIPYFAFLRSRNFKIKTVHFAKLGIYSQGILFKLSVFPQPDIKHSVGFDATTILGIQQIVEDVDEAGIAETTGMAKFLETNTVGKFIDSKMMRYKWYRGFRKYLRQPKGIWHPYFPGKSDEENVQKIFTKMKEKYGDRKWYVSEKLEGQNISMVSRRTKIAGFFNKHDFGVCSRTRFLPTYDGTGFWRTVRKHKYDVVMKNIPGSWFVRGEHCGASTNCSAIQGNIYNFADTDIYVFDVFEWITPDTRRMLSLNEMLEFCAEHGFKHVPIIDTNFVLPDTVGELLDYSNGYSVYGDKVLREGVVIRLVDDPTVSFKVRSPQYLVKQGTAKD